MSRSAKFVVISAVVLLLAGAVGAGAFVWSQHQENERQAAAEQARQERAEEESQEKAEEEARAYEDAKATYTECNQQIGGLLKALKEVDARLDVGLNQDDFSSLVGDVSVAYNRLNVDRLVQTGRECLNAAAKMEKAFNGYNQTASDWEDCIFDYSCSVEDIESGMQETWAKSSRQIERAETLLDQMDPDSPSYRKGADTGV